ncbi:hypothetical protein RJ641_034473 [Dillenia turbinata]|uniref:Uncharacterized protein n=1 Tax=Dillenia turbinata TaxID=194707 RepID=A0AAN8VUI5_9MAGN
MENVNGDVGDTPFFTDKELADIYDLQRRGDHIEVTCGCRSSGFGNLSPAAFIKHTPKRGQSNWLHSIWVTTMDGNKVPLKETVLLKYYKPNESESSCKRKLPSLVHRDEFIKCSKCNKERRFERRSKIQCRIYHDASNNKMWKCTDSVDGSLTCETEEERFSRKALCGCPRAISCQGCRRCICLGCDMCHFEDCSCRACLDFFQNVGF